MTIKRIALVLGNLLICAVLFGISTYSYVLFHTISEVIGIAAAWAIFMLVWNARSIIENKMLLLLGIGLFCISWMDLTHTMAFKGINVFAGFDSNLSAQLWIMARFFESVTFLAACFYVKRPFRVTLALLLFSVASGLLLISAFLRIFPDCYIEGTGLTLFKILSEYAIILVFAAALIRFLGLRSLFQKEVFALLIGSLAAKILSEASFTLYTDVTGIFNMAGHILKIYSFYMLYIAIIQNGVLTPFNLLFRELKVKEGHLLAEKKELEKALGKIKNLHGLLPICASCKKIRDDTGYWNQIEDYIQQHSDADFSHGLCPDCAKKLYPELNE